MKKFSGNGWKRLSLLLGGIMVVLIFQKLLDSTSTDDFCQSCHVHPQADKSWKRGAHFDNASGTVAHCADCHLPPAGFDYLTAKFSTGTRDLFSYLFKNPEEFDWRIASTRDAASRHVYKAGCVSCHQNLFSRDLSKKGQDAHLHYSNKANSLRCINCHLEVGHFHKKKRRQDMISAVKKAMKFTQATQVSAFQNFVENIPGTAVSFKMIAIPGGEFQMGSPPDEAGRKPDEGPLHTVHVDSFWMGEIEVSWQQYDAFYRETSTAGRTEDQIGTRVDAISGPTPAYGDPSQGWGRGSRPAITMTYYAAEKYCQWLSGKTGKIYRLPTEAEWEYACRAGSQTPYFFAGRADDFDPEKFSNRIFGIDTTINSYIFYAGNSQGKTHQPDEVTANAFGLKNMPGNVKEFCRDWYAAGAYSQFSKDEIAFNPTGPRDGVEHVLRGGSYKSDAGAVRAAAREQTHTKQWMRTDPQLPKSLWWYSDNTEVGFRVVCQNAINSK